MRTTPRQDQRKLDESYAFCHKLAKRTGRNFYYSFLTLPHEIRRQMCALYAYMRICDDIGDEGTVDAESRRRSLDEWRTEVVAALESGDSRHPALPALIDVVDRKQVPHHALLAVIDGVAMDLDPKRFATFEELTEYCYHVAGAVGLCCIHVWGFEGDEAPDRAIDCGLAFQLTNILRDIGEDAAVGRVYLPSEDLDRFGVCEEHLATGRVDEPFRRLMAFEVERAREYYDRAAPLARMIEPAGRPVLTAMRRIYGGLLDEIERRDFDVFSRRVALPRWKKLTIVARSMWRRET
jgi:phytoene synthase